MVVVLDSVKGKVTQHASFLNFALGQRWEVGREAKFIHLFIYSCSYDLQ